MCLMNESFTDLVKKKIVEPQEAYAKAARQGGPADHVQEEQHRHVLGARRSRERPARRPTRLSVRVLRRRRRRPGPDAVLRGGRGGSSSGARSLIYPTDTLYALGGRGAATPAAAARRARGQGPRGGQAAAARRRGPGAGAARSAAPLARPAADAGRALLAGPAHAGAPGRAGRSRTRSRRAAGTVAVRVPALELAAARCAAAPGRSSPPRPTAPAAPPPPTCAEARRRRAGSRRRWRSTPGPGRPLALDASWT